VGLPSFAAQQQGVALAERFSEIATDVVVPIGNEPSAMGKASIGIFIYPTR